MLSIGDQIPWKIQNEKKFNLFYYGYFSKKLFIVLIFSCLCFVVRLLFFHCILKKNMLFKKLFLFYFIYTTTKTVWLACIDLAPKS